MSEDQRTTVVACDPEGSILAGGEVGTYQVEGIGYVSRLEIDRRVDRLAHSQDFFPEVLDMSPRIIDHWVKTNDEGSFKETKRLM